MNDTTASNEPDRAKHETRMRRHPLFARVGTHPEAASTAQAGARYAPRCVRRAAASALALLSLVLVESPAASATTTGSTVDSTESRPPAAAPCPDGSVSSVG